MNNPILEHNTYYCELPSRGLITLNGPDAAKFLQGQVTCDIRELTQPTTLLGAQCNLKGRVMANFRALQTNPESILLCLSTDLIADTIANLNKYIVFSKAKLQNSVQEYRLVGLYGESAAALVESYFGQSPITQDSWIANDGCYAIKLEEQRYECWILASSMTEFMANIAKSALNTSDNLWNLLDIRAGIAWITSSTRELFTPQALNYQLINAINFRKGCYTGQEIVARMHYRGKLKRHLYRYDMQANQLPTLGTQICHNEQVLGEIVSTAFSQEGRIELLASINGDVIDALHLVNNSEILKRLRLPYAIPSEEENSSDS